MKLFEIVTLTNKGHWTVKEMDGVRHWTPVFGEQSVDGLLPFETTQISRQDPTVYQVPAYNLTPPKVKRRELPETDREMLPKLEDALKRRSNTDVIDDDVFMDLVNKCAAGCISKAGLKKASPKQIVIITPGSSSPIAEIFAKAIQRQLKVEQEHVFFGHFEKRRLEDFTLQAEFSDTIPDDEKEKMIPKLYNTLAGDPDAKVQSKNIRRGHRDVYRKHGIHTMDVSKDFGLKYNKVPILLVVDDNIQQGTTYKTAAKLFAENTGVQPSKTIALAMFKYI